jgi:hypothetical protein
MRTITITCAPVAFDFGYFGLNDSSSPSLAKNWRVFNPFEDNKLGPPIYTSVIANSSNPNGWNLSYSAPYYKLYKSRIFNDFNSPPPPIQVEITYDESGHYQTRLGASIQQTPGGEEFAGGYDSTIPRPNDGFTGIVIIAPSGAIADYLSIPYYDYRFQDHAFYIWHGVIGRIGFSDTYNHPGGFTPWKDALVQDETPDTEPYDRPFPNYGIMVNQTNTVSFTAPLPETPSLYNMFRYADVRADVMPYAAIPDFSHYKWYWGDGTTPTETAERTVAHTFERPTDGVFLVMVDSWGRETGPERAFETVYGGPYTPGFSGLVGFTAPYGDYPSPFPYRAGPWRVYPVCKFTITPDRDDPTKLTLDASESYSLETYASPIQSYFGLVDTVGGGVGGLLSGQESDSSPVKTHRPSNEQEYIYAITVKLPPSPRNPHQNTLQTVALQHFTVLVPEKIVLLWDKRSGTTRVGFRRTNANFQSLLPCTRDLELTSPALDDSAAVVASSSATSGVLDRPVGLRRFGVTLWLDTAQGRMYHSIDEGLTWQYDGQFVSGAQVWGTCNGHDGAFHYMLFNWDEIFGNFDPTGGNQLKVRWSAPERNRQGEVTGLPVALRNRAKVLLKVGVTGFLLIAERLAEDATYDPEKRTYGPTDIVLYTSDDELATWHEGGVLAPTSRLLGAICSADKSQVFLLTQDADNHTLQRTLWQADSGEWQASEARTVEGIPVEEYSESALDSDGVIMIAVFKNTIATRLAASYDNGLNWTLAESE